MPIQASASTMPWVHSGRLRASSVSSMRSTNVPPRLPGERPVVQRRARPADVEEPRRRRGDRGTRRRRTMASVLDATRVSVERQPGWAQRRDAGEGEVAQLAQGDRQGGQVVALGAADLGEHRRRPGDRSLVGLQPLRRRSRRRCSITVVGQLGERRQQVVAQRRAGLGLPAVRSRQRADAVPQPDQVEARRTSPSRRAATSAMSRAVGGGHLDEVEPGVQQRPHAGPLGEVLGHAGGQPRRLDRAHDVGHPPDEHRLRATGPAPRCPGRNSATAAPMSIGGRRWRSSHSAARSTIRRQSRNRSSWTSSGTSPVERVDLGPQRRRSRGRRGPTTQARVTSTTDAPVSSVMRWSNEMPDRLTIWLTSCVAMISRRSRCRRIGVGVALAQLGREVADEVGLEQRRRRAGRCAPSRRRWRSSCRRSARRTRASCSPCPAAWRSAICLSVGRNSSVAVQPALGLEHVEVAGVHVDHRQRLAAGDRPAPASAPGCRRGPARRPRRSSTRAARCAASIVSSPASTIAVEQDLDVDLVVAAVDAGRVVDRVGVDEPAAERVLDPPALGEARGCRPRRPSGSAARLPLTRTPSLARSPTSAWDSRRRLDVGADAAVPQQVDRRPQHGRHQLVRRQRSGRSRRARRAPAALSSIDFSVRGYTPPPGGDAAPGRSRPSSSGAARTAACARRTPPRDRGRGR